MLDVVFVNDVEMCLNVFVNGDKMMEMIVIVCVLV